VGYHRSFFGVGYVTAIGSGTYPTPINIAIIRGATVEFKSTEKVLKGNKLAPVDSATTDISITGKVQTSDFDARLVGLVIPGTTTATGQTKAATHSATIPGTPFEVTVTNSATWVTDLGVVNLTNGTVMTRAATATGTGVYAAAAGVYTFNTADAADSVAIAYTYTAATGTTLTSTNQTSGATSGYALRLSDPPGGTRENGIYLPSVKFSNLSLGMKIDDWTETSLDFTAFEDATGNLFYTYGNE
jgi:hypothetical protein